MSYLTSGMNRAFAAVAALFVVAALAPQIAHADAKAKKAIESRNAQAMENFDLLEFDEAKRLLSEAASIAKKAGLKDKAVAQVYLNLGIVYFAGFEDKESAKIAFIDAVQIDSSVEIGAAYRTEPMAKLLSEARDQYGSSADSGSDGGSAAADVDCDSVEGFQHELVEEGTAGKSQKFTANVGSDVKATRVSLFYRVKGATKFKQIKLKKNGCTYSGSIPGKQFRGQIVHYYLTAFRNDKKVAAKGSRGSPNIVEVLKPEGGDSSSFGDDDEDPLSGGKTTTKVSTSSGGGVKKIGTVGGDKRAKIFVSVAAGTGGGYVTGETEQVRSDVGCCFAPALLHVFPEIGYYLSPQLSISLAFRMGFPIGANRPGAATGAPAGLARARYALSDDGNGINVSGMIGAGIMRHTVKIDNTAPGEDTDTTASGPVLLGAGIGFIRPLSGALKFVAELNTIAGLTMGVTELGPCPDDGCIRPSFALQFDANLGVMFAF